MKHVLVKGSLILEALQAESNSAFDTLWNVLQSPNVRGFITSDDLDDLFTQLVQEQNLENAFVLLTEIQRVLTIYSPHQGLPVDVAIAQETQDILDVLFYLDVPILSVENFLARYSLEELYEHDVFPRCLRDWHRKWRESGLDPLLMVPIVLALALQNPGFLHSLLEILLKPVPSSTEASNSGTVEAIAQTIRPLETPIAMDLPPPSAEASHQSTDSAPVVSTDQNTAPSFGHLPPESTSNLRVIAPGAHAAPASTATVWLTPISISSQVTPLPEVSLRPAPNPHEFTATLSSSAPSGNLPRSLPPSQVSTESSDPAPSTHPQPASTSPVPLSTPVASTPEPPIPVTSTSVTSTPVTSTPVISRADAPLSMPGSNPSEVIVMMEEVETIYSLWVESLLEYAPATDEDNVTTGSYADTQDDNLQDDDLTVSEGDGSFAISDPDSAEPRPDDGEVEDTGITPENQVGDLEDPPLAHDNPSEVPSDSPIIQDIDPLTGTTGDHSLELPANDNMLSGNMASGKNPEMPMSEVLGGAFGGAIAVEGLLDLPLELRLQPTLLDSTRWVTPLLNDAWGNDRPTSPPYLEMIEMIEIRSMDVAQL